MSKMRECGTFLGLAVVSFWSVSSLALALAVVRFYLREWREKRAEPWAEFYDHLQG